MVKERYLQFANCKYRTCLIDKDSVLTITILRYCNDENRQNSMTLNQRQNLIEAIDNIIRTSKNERVVTDLKDALEYLQSRGKRNNIPMASEPQN